MRARRDGAKHSPIVSLVLRYHIIGAIFFPGIDDEPSVPWRVRGPAGIRFERILCRRRDVPRRVQVTVHPVLDHFRNSADVGGHDRNLTGHGFERGQAERFHVRRQQKQVRLRQELVDAVLLSEEMNVARELLLAGQIFGSATVRPVADQHQFGGKLLAD